jgi:hypothetical protein
MAIHRDAALGGQVEDTKIYGSAAEAGTIRITSEAVHGTLLACVRPFLAVVTFGTPLIAEVRVKKIAVVTSQAHFQGLTGCTGVGAGRTNSELIFIISRERYTTFCLFVHGAVVPYRITIEADPVIVAEDAVDGTPRTGHRHQI